MSIKKQQKLRLINIGMFIIFLVWNYWQPLTADDYGYVFLNAVHNNNLYKILHYRYFNWDGRLSADALVLILFNQSTFKYILPLINLINALTLLGIFNLIYKFIYGRHYDIHKYLLTALLYMVFFIAVGTFAQDFLWKTVAVQYAWGFVLLLYIIWRFYLDLEADVARHCSKLQLFLYAMAGAFIGLYSEIYVAFVADVYLTAIIVWYLFKKPLAQLFKVQYLGFSLATMAGGVVLIIAPGNFIHQGYYLVDNHLTTSSYNLLEKILMTYVQFFRYGYHIGLAVILAYIGYWLLKQRKLLPRHDVEYITFLLILLNVHILSFAGIAYYSPISGRMLIFMDSIIFILLFRFGILKFAEVRLSATASMKYRYALYISITAVYVVVSSAYYNFHQFIRSRQLYIEQNPQAVTLPGYKGNFIFKYIVYFDFMRTPDSDFKKMYLDININ